MFFNLQSVPLAVITGAISIMSCWQCRRLRDDLEDFPFCLYFLSSTFTIVNERLQLSGEQVFTTHLVLNGRDYSSCYSNWGRGLIRFLYSPHFDMSDMIVDALWTAVKWLTLIPYDTVQNKYQMRLAPHRHKTRKKHAITCSINWQGISAHVKCHQKHETKTE